MPSDKEAEQEQSVSEGAAGTLQRNSFKGQKQRKGKGTSEGQRAVIMSKIVDGMISF